MVKGLNSTNPMNPTNSVIDNTVKIAKRFTDKVYNKGPERSAQSNFGIQKANGKYVIYPDANMVLSEKCFKKICR